eukprot:gene3027-3486_t
MDLYMLAIVFVQLFMQCSARWYFAVRPVYDLRNGTYALTRTLRTLKKTNHPHDDRQCRKDKQCGKGRFCYRHLGTCHNCRRNGEICRRNHMCCKGFTCVAGVCRPVMPAGLEGALCRKSKDCRPGLCCSKATIGNGGKPTCRRYLQEGDACGLIDRSPRFQINHICLCDTGLKCRKVRRISKR